MGGAIGNSFVGVGAFISGVSSMGGAVGNSFVGVDIVVSGSGGGAGVGAVGLLVGVGAVIWGVD